MKRFFALVSLLCSICILFSSCTLIPVGRIIGEWGVMMEESLEEDIIRDPPELPSADEESNDALLELEREYGIDIKDPDGLLTDENAAVVGESLSILSQPVIDGILEHLEEGGYDFSLSFADETYDALGETVFSYDEIEIIIYAPRKTYDSEMTNGITVETIVHEFGHVIHDIIECDYDGYLFEKNWLLLNGPYEYEDEWDDNAERYFAYDYGMTDYYEDVATVFEDLAAYPIVTESRLSQEENDPLYLKAKHLYEKTDDLFDLSESSLFDPFLSAKERRGDTKSFEESLELFLEQEPGLKPEYEDPFDFDLFDDLFGFAFDEEDYVA